MSTHLDQVWSATTRVCPHHLADVSSTVPDGSHSATDEQDGEHGMARVRFNQERIDECQRRQDEAVASMLESVGRQSAKREATAQRQERRGRWHTALMAAGVVVGVVAIAVTMIIAFDDVSAPQPPATTSCVPVGSAAQQQLPCP